MTGNNIPTPRENGKETIMSENFDLTTTAPAAQQMLAAQTVEADGVSLIADLTNAQTAYCSLVAEDERAKATLYNATNSTQERIGDHINETISVAHIYVEAVQCTNRETGEIKTCPRVVLITDKGIGYQAVSIGVYGSVKKLIQIFGEPQTWTKPLKLKIKQLTRGEFKILTLEIAQ